MADDLAISDPQPIAQVARIFKCIANPMRLRILLALESRECDIRQLAQALSHFDPKHVSAHLQSLHEEGLARRRSIGRGAVYSLSSAGIGVVQAYRVILRQFRLDPTAPPEQTIGAGAAEAEPMPQVRLVEPAYVVDAADLLNRGANPSRLRLLFTLAGGDRDTAQLSHELGDINLSLVNRHISVLQDGHLVTSHRSGKQHIYTLTLNGLGLVQALRATCSGLTIRRGELTLRPEPIRAGEDGALDPTSPDGLACLLWAFADPIRLRVLNLLVAAGEVCSCHLPEVLQLRRQAVLQSLAYARKAGLVLDRQERQWVFLRPSPSASNFCRSLMGCFGPRLRDADVFEADRQRLHGLQACPNSPPPVPQDDRAASSARNAASGHHKGAARTA